jgi:PST family polysaccharide transporter
MASVLVAFAAIFVDLGSSSALIQKEHIDNRHLSSAFWMNIAAGVVLMLLMMAAAPLICRFFRRPELLWVVVAVSSNLALGSLAAVQQTILAREMNFRGLALRDMLSIVTGGCVGISAALFGCKVWSLVLQSLASSLVNVVVMWRLSSWRPEAKISWAAIREIMPFGSHVTGFNIVNYFARNLDQLLIGRLIGSQALGCYNLAYKLMLYPLQNVSSVVGQVMFPAFSKLQGHRIKMREVYLRMTRAISLVTFPLMTVVFVLSSQLVLTVFGARWAPAIPLVKVLCLCGLAQSILTTGGNVMLSLGRSDLQLKFGLVGAIWACASIVVGFRWGLLGVCSTYTIGQIFWTVFVQVAIINRLLGISTWRMAANLFPSALVGLVVMAGVQLAVLLLHFDVGWSGLTAYSGVAIVGFVVCLLAVGEISVRAGTVQLRVLRGIE